MLKVGSIKGAPTLTEKLETAVQPEADKLATNHPEAHKLTQEAVKEAWLAYADSIPLKKMFVNLMRSVDPLWSPDKPLTVSLLLANDLQKDLVETEWNDVKAFMEKKLSANGLQLSIELSKSDKPQLWTEKQALEHMLQAHPDMKKFIQDLGLTLS